MIQNEFNTVHLIQTAFGAVFGFDKDLNLLKLWSHIILLGERA